VVSAGAEGLEKAVEEVLEDYEQGGGITPEVTKDTYSPHFSLSGSMLMTN